jgi:hypothetical protein
MTLKSTKLIVLFFVIAALITLSVATVYWLNDSNDSSSLGNESQNESLIYIPEGNGSSGNSTNSSDNASTTSNTTNTTNNTSNNTSTINASGNGSGSGGSSSNRDRTAPVISVDPISGSWVTDVTVSLQVTDDRSGVSKVYFDNGSLTISSFDTSTATDITSSLNAGKYSFLADENDDYTILAVDGAGNKAVEIVPISTIDKTAPAVTVDPISTTWTNSDITVTFAATDADSGISNVYFDNGTLTVDNFDISTATDITSSLSGGKYSFLAGVNDDYTIFAVDNAGNKVVGDVTILTIDKTAPAHCS